MCVFFGLVSVLLALRGAASHTIMEKIENDHHLQANIAATVPYTTVLDKLQQDPTLSDTFTLGRFGEFNLQLNNTLKKFTYFVPRNKAWNDARVAIPPTVKKLFMSDFGYYTQQILQRHLIESDTLYTMERIKQLTADTLQGSNVEVRKEVELQSQRGFLRISVEERQDHSFIIHWRGLKIPVFQPNVECTNGIIHVIDAPFLQEDDLPVISDPATSTDSPDRDELKI